MVARVVCPGPASWPESHVPSRRKHERGDSEAVSAFAMLRSSAQAEVRDQLAISLDVRTLQISEESTTAANHLQKAATSVMILLALVEMFTKRVDALGEQGDLHGGAPDVAVVELVLLDNLLLVDAHVVQGLLRSRTLQGKHRWAPYALQPNTLTENHVGLKISRAFPTSLPICSTSPSTDSKERTPRIRSMKSTRSRSPYRSRSASSRCTSTVGVAPGKVGRGPRWSAPGIPPLPRIHTRTA